MTIDDNLIEKRGPGRPPKGDSELEKLRTQVEELTAKLNQAVTQGVVKVPQVSNVLRVKRKPDPLVMMTLLDKGVGKISNGENSGFGRYETFGDVFEAPMSGARLLWNRDYATPVDRSIIEPWKRQNEIERIGLMNSRDKLNKLLERVDYYGNVTAPLTEDHRQVA